MFYSCTTCCHPWFSKHVTNVIIPFPIKAGGLGCLPDHTRQTSEARHPIPIILHSHKRWKAHCFSSSDSQTNCLGKTWVFCFCLFRISDREGGAGVISTYLLFLLTKAWKVPQTPHHPHSQWPACRFSGPIKP